MPEIASELYGPAMRGRVTLTNPEPSNTQRQRTDATSHPSRTSSAISLARFYTPADELIPARADARDGWHIDRVVCVPLAGSVPAVKISLAFPPTHGPVTVGVALTQLALSRGLIDPRKPLFITLPQVPKIGRLVFSWPDYPNVRASAPLVLKDDAGQYINRGSFGKQIALLFGEFIEKHAHEYVTPAGRRGWRLGNGGIKHQQLRLLEISPPMGRSFMRGWVWCLRVMVRL
ncbi:hypothetical protein B0H19DRAFT_1258585 [Mycena capillaripes]|nr:hypothetical protein B0H19DRAFT_1258585 [Mycena capillaripes]